MFSAVVPKLVAAPIVVRSAPVTVPSTLMVLPVAVSTVAPVVARCAVRFDVSVIVAAPPATVTAPIRVLLLLRVTALPVKLLPPTTVSAPATSWVMAPPVEVTVSGPVMVEAPRIMPPVVSFSFTLLALTTLTTPPKLLFWVLRSMLLPPAVRLVVPLATVNAPVCVTPPSARNVRLVPTVVVPSVVASPDLVLSNPVVVPLRVRALASLKVTSLPLTMITVPKSFEASARVMLLAPAVRVVVPPTIKGDAPFIAPLATRVRLPLPVDTLPNGKAPMLFSEMLPLFRWVSALTALVAVKSTGTVCPMLPAVILMVAAVTSTVPALVELMVPV